MANVAYKYMVQDGKWTSSFVAGVINAAMGENAGKIRIFGRDWVNLL